MMKLLAVIGNPISHSRSPLIHNNAIKSSNIKNACYTRLLLEDSSNLKEAFTKLNLYGANITVPFKEEAFKICDELDEFAKEIGSVNTITYKNNKLYGKNTDAPGFLKAIEEFSGIKKAVILGAGGTTRAIAQALKDANIEVTVLNRSPQRLEFFARKGYKVSLMDEYTPSELDILINTTSAGLQQDELPCKKELLDKLISLTKYGFDVIYGKNTPFILELKNANKPYKDGSDMLLFQAYFAFEEFFDGNINKDVVLEAMKRSFLL